MLILTRRFGESIIIGEGDNKITITMLGITGNQSRIGIEAPKEITVHREEIFQKIHHEDVGKHKWIKKVDKNHRN